MYYNLPAEYLNYVLVLGLGLSVGSFLNVVVYRLPRQGLSLAQPRRSFCPACGTSIRWYDKIPLLSWLYLRARCRDCHKPISARYPLVELASGLLALYLFNFYGPSAVFLFQLYFVLCLLAIALIDLELMVIPTQLIYPTAILGLLSAALHPSAILAGPWLWLNLEQKLGPHLTSLAGSTAGFALGWAALKLMAVAYQATRGHKGLGDSDPPLLGLIGVWLGWRAIPTVILWSTLIGLASVIMLIIMDSKSKSEESWSQKAIPFGPFLVLATFLYLCFGPTFINWYQRLYH
ncbi:MAG: hypothetical protein AMR96_02160 [Candidatus Adiutrix intracellularis]|jgi:leader peptidase (prepilin peptidase)/N-methyltransferase|nr:MAG: hypothetical protein AMR96_02160 [Candidatus Adiutrix intracellularis]MDR2827492.1 prepilin peptidase [Candidatus Adiutrix intracellularis]